MEPLSKVTYNSHQFVASKQVSVQRLSWWHVQFRGKPINIFPGGVPETISAPCRQTGLINKPGNLSILLITYSPTQGCCFLCLLVLVFMSCSGGGGGIQIWVGQGCTARASKPLPMFKGDFGRKGYPFFKNFVIFGENPKIWAQSEKLTHV